MEGYHKLACLMQEVPDVAIFKRFRNANHLNLLLLQAEVVNLEYKLGQIVRQDRASNSPDAANFEKHVYRLKSSPEGSDQWQTILELRALLKEYNEALLVNRALHDLPSASQVNMRALRQWLIHNDGGNDFLKPFEDTVWATDSDLTALSAEREKLDVITQWVHDKFVLWYHNTIGKRHKDLKMSLHNPALSKQPVTTTITVYQDQTITFVISAISTVLSSVIPVASIVVLYYVRRPLRRLGVILVFTLLFSIIIASISRSRRIENFAATAAFCAVLVVFVGNGPNIANGSA